MREPAVPRPTATASGESLFARYAYPPNELGHCGPPGAPAMLAAGSVRDSGPEGDTADLVRRRAPYFEGAWAYLQLLAAAAGSPDPLDRDVVSAYWLGGPLLDRVDSGALTALVEATFAAQPGVRGRLPNLAELAVAGPSHAFHVFVIYPWVGLLGGGSDVPRAILDRCRVRWGTVESVDSDHAMVRSRPLTWDGVALGLGGERAQTCRWRRGPDAFVRALEVGETVSLHWDWVCDRLDRPAERELADRAQRQLAATNAWLRRGDGRE